ncbi:MAG TPA: site-specific integrase [Tepidisphaeraceae bacterium]|nr:site-specific integrase [Tepidisphaeraceae bacterium]
MPRLVHSNPKYRKHHASGQAVVTLDGRDFYLGPYGTAASRTEYDRLVGEWLANGRRIQQEKGENAITVASLILAYWRFAKTYYRKPDGSPTTEQDKIKSSLRVLRRLYGQTPATEFGPLALKATRQEMVAMGWCRNHVNQSVGRIRRCFKWGVENELVPPSVYQGLTAVTGLRAWRSEASESEPVRPVADDHVNVVLPHCSRQVAAMIRLQRLTGARPGEICIMRTGDIDTTGRLWLYRPSAHKTQHHGHERIIYLGPKSQEIVRPFFKADLKAYLFSPAEADAERRAAMHEQRKLEGTPLSCGNVPGSHRKRSPKRAPGACYSVNTYAQTIRNACDLAFPLPERMLRQRVPGRKRENTRWETEAEWKARLGPEKWAEVLTWQSEHRFHPHQLRHTAATELRKNYGLEAAQVILGHKTLTVTQIYAQKNIQAARQIMAEVG